MKYGTLRQSAGAQARQPAPGVVQLGFDPFAASEPLGRRATRIALVGAAHLLVLAGLFAAATRPEAQQVLHELQVRFIAPEAPPPQVTQPPQPLPVRAKQAVRRSNPLPPPVMAAAPEATVAAPAFVVPAPAEPAPAVAAPPPAPPAPFVAARFDADYLHNPAPAYPRSSARRNEQGQVLLKVRVSAEGRALQVDLHRSSGYAELDEAALGAVRQWRFVPARRGDEAVAANVIVPIDFKLGR